jgi:hypothetical protein
MNSANEYRPMTELLAGIVETKEEETQERVVQPCEKQPKEKKA